VLRKITQVEFDQSNDSANNATTWFFLVKKKSDSYTMLHVSHHANPSCKGPDRLDAIKDR
jgi:hypothetical protein